jgi:hypothetical protein
MAFRSRLVATLVGVLLAAGASTSAQTIGVTTGALNGRVSDQTGALLPGVAVTVSGDAVMGARPAITDARGSYDVPLLPPGDVTVVFSLQGFRTEIRKGVRVTLGETVTVDAVLELASTADTVTVSGSPVIDRSGTAIAVNLDANMLADIPGSRGMSAILAATPSVHLARFDVGGSAAVDAGVMSAYGTGPTNGMNRPTIEGVSIARHNPLGFTVDYGSFEHVAVGLGAYAPESAWPGVQIRFITSSGGNRHHGSVYLDYENRRWQSFNIDKDQVDRASAGPGLQPREANRLWGYHDANVDAGGPLQKDRLWWYVSLRAQETSAKQVSFPVKPLRNDIVNVGGKATAQARGNNRFVVFAQATRNRQPYRLSRFLPPTMGSVNTHEDSTAKQDAEGGVWKVEWNSRAGPRLYFELLAGQFIAGRHERPNGTSARFEDTNPSQPVVGGNRDWAERHRNDQLSGSAMSTIAGPAGIHDVRAGGGIERMSLAERWRFSYPDGVLHVRQNGQPVEVYFFQTPSLSKSGVQWYSAHVNDSWRATGRLTINLGLRFDRYRAFLPAQEHPAGQSRYRSWTSERFFPKDNLIDWNVLAPRVGVIHDLTGDGRTVLKATYGRYWLPPGPDLLFNANPNSREWWEKAKWTDTDGDGGWDPGEEGPIDQRRGGTEIESLDEGLRLDFMREVTARLEREIAANTRVATGVVWRGHRQPFLRQDDRPFNAFGRPVPVTDPGPDGLRGNADDGPQIVVHDLLERPPLPSYRVANVPNASRDHLTWELTANRRLRGRWWILAGFSHTWARDHAAGYSGQTVRANMYPLTPNDLINTGENGRHEVRVWSARASGTWEGPWGLRITPFLRHQSGQPYGRTFLVRGLNLGNSLRVLAEPIGTRRMDNITLVDLRVEKGFRIDKDRRIAMFFDVFNLLNANPELSVDWSSDAPGVFRRPIIIVPPRIARVGLKVAW